MIRKLTPTPFDALFALVAWVAMSVEVVVKDDPSLPLSIQLLLLAVMGVALAVRRRVGLIAGTLALTAVTGVLHFATDLSVATFVLAGLSLAGLAWLLPSPVPRLRELPAPA